MKVDNPFDPVKDQRRSTFKVDFVAMSPALRAFKDDVETILDLTNSSVKQFHAIVGDYGWGKSHINHYLLERALENDKILVSYVQCKNLLQTINEGRRLFNLLLNRLILELQENAPDEIKKKIEDIQKASSTKLKIAYQDLEKAKHADDDAAKKTMYTTMVDEVKKIPSGDVNKVPLRRRPRLGGSDRSGR